MSYSTKEIAALTRELEEQGFTNKQALKIIENALYMERTRLIRSVLRPFGENYMGMAEALVSAVGVPNHDGTIDLSIAGAINNLAEAINEDR